MTGEVDMPERTREIDRILKLFRKFWIRRNSLRFGQAVCVAAKEGLEPKDVFHISDAVWEYVLNEKTRVVRAHKIIEHIGIKRRMEFKLYSDGMIELSGEGMLNPEDAAEMIRFMSQSVTDLGKGTYTKSVPCSKCGSRYITDDIQANWCGCKTVKEEE